MHYFLKANKNLITFLLIVLLIIPIFGVNLFMSFLGNILLLLFLIPLLLLVLVFIGFNSFKSKVKTCSSCGADLENINKQNQLDKKPSQSTIDVKAEEIK